MTRRSTVLGLAVLCFSLLASLDLRAAAPANDQCSGAETIPSFGPFPWLTSIVTNIQDALTVNDPPPPTNCFGGQISRSVWYQFTPADTALYTVSLKFTATTMQDTLLGIYTSPAGCSGPFTQYVCNDDIGTLQSAVTTNFSAGVTYYMVVWHTLTNAPPEGQRSLQLKVAKVEPPMNDICEFAAEIPSAASNFPYWTTTTNTHLATTDNDPAGSLCSTGRRSVWFKFRPEIGGSYIIATCTNNTATKIYNTMMVLYENTGGCGGTMNLLQCNPGFCGTSAAIIRQLTPGTDYYIVVWDVDAEALTDETDVQLFVERQGPPTVTTIGHSNAQPTTVTLIGSANPKGVVTRGYFEWSTTPGVYNNITAPSSTLGVGIVDFPYSRALFDQAPGTTIYYRAVAFNSFGTVHGEGKSVTLPFPRPNIHTITREGGGLRIQFTGSEGYTHAVEVSEDLRNWTRLGDATPLEFDEFEYIDPGPLNGTQRFYRIKL